MIPLLAAIADRKSLVAQKRFDFPLRFRIVKRTSQCAAGSRRTGAPVLGLRRSVSHRRAVSSRRGGRRIRGANRGGCVSRQRYGRCCAGSRRVSRLRHRISGAPHTLRAPWGASVRLAGLGAQRFSTLSLATLGVMLTVFNILLGGLAAPAQCADPVRQAAERPRQPHRHRPVRSDAGADCGRAAVSRLSAAGADQRVGRSAGDSGDRDFIRGHAPRAERGPLAKRRDDHAGRLRTRPRAPHFRLDTRLGHYPHRLQHTSFSSSFYFPGIHPTANDRYDSMGA